MKHTKRILCLLMMVMLIVTSVLPVTVSAAGDTSAIALSKKAATLYVGKTLQLKVTGTASTVKWSTSSKKIASVTNKGKVKAVKAGSTTITAKVGTSSLTCKVTVKNPSINKTSISIYVGKTYTLKLLGTSLKATTTSKKSIASVSKKGVVTAKKAGKATITLTGTNKKKYSCKVTVKSSTISPAKLELEKGKSYTLKLTGTTIKSVKTSNKSIATVSKAGKVTGVKLGKVDITLIGKNGLKHTCKVTVVKPKILVTSVTIQSDDISLYPGDTKQLTALVLPENADKRSLTWISSDSSVATVKNGFISAISPGSCTILAAAQDTSRKADYIDVTVVPKEAGYTGTVSLTSSVTEVEASGNDQLAYFYAEVPEGYTYVELFTTKSQDPVAVMLDDGAYSTSGDDIPNDGLYSAKITLNSSVEKEETYYAVIKKSKNNSNESLVTSTLNITFYTKITLQQIQNMESVNNSVSDLISSSDFEDLSSTQQIQSVQNKLDALETSGKIAEDSIQYDTASNMFYFQYAGGVLGGVSLSEFTNDLNGTSAGGNFTLNNDISVSNTTNDQMKIADALILHAFDSSDFRMNYYYNTKADWDARGLNTTIDFDVTLSDLKSISDSYEVVCFSGHGSYYKQNPVICTEEAVTSDKNELYSSDLKSNRVASVTTTSGGTYYWVLPVFFSNYYSEHYFDNTFIFSECCEFYGYNEIHSTAFADVFTGAGAKTVVGFYNSVNAVYSRDFMKFYIDQLIEGKTAQDAFNTTILDKNMGPNDKHPGKGSGNTYQPGPAIPQFSGMKLARLIETYLKNGSFEESKVLSGWQTEGDVREISKLGELLPKDGSKMAILTTGIGSKEALYLQGTEGSMLYRIFVLPDDATTISFWYDVVSEEPMEYVNSKFDDKFYARIEDEDGAILSLATESVNETVWYPIDNIDFEGGDDTTYHSEWKKVIMDVSDFAGKTITLKFVTFDVGDSIYDTAVLVDAVVVS